MNDLSEVITLRARIEELEREKIAAETRLRAVTEAGDAMRKMLNTAVSAPVDQWPDDASICRAVHNWDAARAQAGKEPAPNGLR